MFECSVLGWLFLMEKPFYLLGLASISYQVRKGCAYSLVVYKKADGWKDRVHVFMQKMSL